MNPGGAFMCQSSTLTILANSGRLVDYYSLFWGPGVISTLTNLWVRLRVGHQQSQFWPILVRLVHYYSPFWGPRAIYTICDPRGAFMCRLSTLTILPNSGPSRGLLLTVLGSQSDFHDSRSRGCVYVPVVNTHSSGQF